MILYVLELVGFGDTGFTRKIYQCFMVYASTYYWWKTVQKCCVLLCDSEYDSGDKTPKFCLPNEKKYSDYHVKLLKRIPSKNIVDSANTRICELNWSQGYLSQQWRNVPWCFTILISKYTIQCYFNSTSIT